MSNNMPIYTQSFPTQSESMRMMSETPHFLLTHIRFGTCKYLGGIDAYWFDSGMHRFHHKIAKR